MERAGMCGLLRKVTAGISIVIDNGRDDQRLISTPAVFAEVGVIFQAKAAAVAIVFKALQQSEPETSRLPLPPGIFAATFLP